MGDGNGVNDSAASGDYSLGGTGTLAAHDEIVGNFGTGSFEQSASTNTIAATLTVGSVVNSTGSYTLSGGTLTANQELVGDHGVGSVTHSAGLNMLTGGSLILGNSAGGSGTYNLSGTGAVTGDVVVGRPERGSLTKPAVRLLRMSTTTRRWRLARAQRAMECIRSAAAPCSPATNILAIQAPELSVSRAAEISLLVLYIGNDFGSSGAYTLSGGDLGAEGTEVVAYSGTGTFTQNGGTHHAYSLYIGENSGSSGTFTLGGNGELHSDNSQYVGYGGTGSFTQNGGTNTMGDLIVGEQVARLARYTCKSGRCWSA